MSWQTGVRIECTIDYSQGWSAEVKRRVSTKTQRSYDLWRTWCRFRQARYHHLVRQASRMKNGESSVIVPTRTRIKKQGTPMRSSRPVHHQSSRHLLLRAWAPPLAEWVAQVYQEGLLGFDCHWHPCRNHWSIPSKMKAYLTWKCEAWEVIPSWKDWSLHCNNSSNNNIKIMLEIALLVASKSYLDEICSRWMPNICCKNQWNMHPIVVENIVKSWEAEIQHKKIPEQIDTIDQKEYSMATNNKTLEDWGYHTPKNTLLLTWGHVSPCVG